MPKPKARARRGATAPAPPATPPTTFAEPSAPAWHGVVFDLSAAAHVHAQLFGAAKPVSLSWPASVAWPDEDAHEPWLVGPNAHARRLYAAERTATDALALWLVDGEPAWARASALSPKSTRHSQANPRPLAMGLFLAAMAQALHPAADKQTPPPCLPWRLIVPGTATADARTALRQATEVAGTAAPIFVPSDWALAQAVAALPEPPSRWLQVELDWHQVRVSVAQQPQAEGPAEIVARRSDTEGGMAQGALEALGHAQAAYAAAFGQGAPDALAQRRLQEASWALAQAALANNAEGDGAKTCLAAMALLPPDPSADVPAPPARVGAVSWRVSTAQAQALADALGARAMAAVQAVAEAAEKAPIDGIVWLGESAWLEGPLGQTLQQQCHALWPHARWLAAPSAAQRAHAAAQAPATTKYFAPADAAAMAQDKPRRPLSLPGDALRALLEQIEHEQQQARLDADAATTASDGDERADADASASA